jgi:hypothetical protein
MIGGLYESWREGTEESYQDIAGVADHAAGSTDEATGRFFDQSGDVASSDLGPIQRANAYSRLMVRHGLGPIGPETENVVWDTPTDQFAGQDDTTDVAGPSAGRVTTGALNVLEAGTDLATQSEDESAAKRAGEKAVLYGILVLIVVGAISYVFGPVLELIGGIAEGTE